MDNVPKLVFSRTLDHLDWHSAKLAKQNIEKEVSALRQQPGKDIFVGSPGLIVSLTNLELIDEYQLCIHPVLAGSGMPLFKNITNKIVLKLINTKIFSNGAVIHYYEPPKENQPLRS
jgi:dihydrofolate reductase